MTNSLVYTTALTSLPEISLTETIRYMGAAGTNDERVRMLAENAIQTVSNLASCKAVYMYVPVSAVVRDTVDLSIFTIYSKSFARYVNDCSFVCVFAATIGLEIDRAIMRASRTSATEALALQAASAAAIETYCDYLCDNIFKPHAQKSDLNLKPRYSAGYGDVSLEYQRAILTALDCCKKIGLTLTDGYMLVPTKSVTGFVGMSKEKYCVTDKCEQCKNTNCLFRKGDQ